MKVVERQLLLSLLPFKSGLSCCPKIYKKILPVVLNVVDEGERAGLFVENKLVV